MSYRPSYSKGDWKAVCDMCGRIFKASALKKRWDNLMVCPEDWEPRHPQDFVRGVVDIQTPPWTRPALDPIWVAGSEVVPPALAPTGAIAGIAIAGYAIAGTS